MMLRFFTHFAASCDGGGILSLPTWYKYLDGNVDAKSGLCTPVMTKLTDVYLIIAAIIEIILRISALAAVAFIIYGGFQFITSRGEPDKAAKARGTVQNALIGLVISISSAAIVTYFAGVIK